MWGKFWNKMKQLNRLFAMKLLATVTIICGLIGSYLYYLPYASHLLEEADRLPMWKIIVATLFSTLKLYMASPTVGLTENVNIFYEIARFTAPIYTATLGVQIFKKTFLNAWNKMKCLGKRKVFVFGYNSNSVTFIKNMVSDQKLQKNGKLKIVLLVDEKLTDENRIELLILGVVIKNINFDLLNSFETKLKFNNLNINSKDVFVLMDKDDQENLKLLQIMRKYIETKKKKFTNPLKCRVLCENLGIKSMIINFDKECKKMMDIKTFDIDELCVQSLFSSKNGSIYKAKKSTNIDTYDVRMMIFGLGKMGQEILTQAISNSVVSNDNKIEFDVFDLDMDEKRELFLQKFHPSMVVECKSHDSRTVSIILNGIDEGDSRVKINFHSYNTQKNSFKQVVTQYAPSATYVAICFREVETIINTLEILRLHLNEDVPIALRMTLTKTYLTNIQSLFKNFSNIFTFGTEKEILTYQNIVNEELEKNAVENNSQYQRIAFIYQNQGKNEWDALTTFEKNSNRAQALHKDIKQEYLKSAYNFDEICEQIKLVKSHIEDSQGLNHFILNNKDIITMAQIEHRRWAYYLIQNGYTTCSEQEFKDKLERYKYCVKSQSNEMNEGDNTNFKIEFKEAYKVHNLLVPWSVLMSNIDSNNSSIFFYDLIPWIMIEEEHANSKLNI